MSTIWTEIREHVDKSDIPQAHKELLDSRRERIISGKAVVHDWDDVKDKIGQHGTQMRQG
jgi:hypothetical protein